MIFYLLGWSYLLNINRDVSTSRRRGRVNDDDWIHNELLLECEGVDIESCVGVEVGLIARDDLDLV